VPNQSKALLGLWEDDGFQPPPPKAFVITHPNRPPVGLMSSDDTPLVVKTGEELPAGMKSRELELALNSVDSHVESIYCVVELFDDHCQKMGPVASLSLQRETERA
jgi:hypothetical protein